MGIARYFEYDNILLKLDIIKVFKIVKGLDNFTMPETLIYKLYSDLTVEKASNMAKYVKIRNFLKKELEKLSLLIIKHKLASIIDPSLLFALDNKEYTKLIPIDLDVYMKVEKTIDYISSKSSANREEKENEFIKDIYQGYIFRSPLFSTATGVVKVDTNESNGYIFSSREEGNAYVLEFYRDLLPSPSSSESSKDLSFFGLITFMEKQLTIFKSLLRYYSNNTEDIENFIEDKASKAGKEDGDTKRDSSVTKNVWIIPGRGDIYYSEY